MNKILLLGLLVPLVIGGIVLADSFFGTLANITYNITSTSNNNVIIPANINLGNLTAGMSGNYSTTAKMSLTSSGYYKFKLNDGALEGEFSNFTVILKFANYTVELTKDHHESEKIYIPSGNYTVTILIYYQVSEHAHNASVSNEGLIYVKETNS
ncbi:hypothetical protein DFR86_10930 [Acidianus sulfidivorans JP7]|uniref:Uncharacterized protein n=1 Tax=Acidianus sulfidivorans JP7 TaxID=619593 RepID=A0A2U9IPM0_9CREN|nr:hypothetical protein [Acidianus sulfidivorans]AWR97998.1 hypothetical protein DFR86_10930 [Acidianus sulfidivorans JP7]